MALESMQCISAYEPVGMVDPAIQIDYDVVKFALNKARNNAVLEPHEKAQSLAFRDWRNAVTAAEASNARSIGVVLYAMRSCEDIDNDATRAQAQKLRVWLVRAYGFSVATPTPDALTCRHIAERASKRHDVMPEKWRQL